jgi:DNA-binding PadR family transcriptional regulator
MRQEVLLALLAKEPSQGFQLRARLNDALGSLGEEMNDGQIYVPLGRLQRAGLVAVERSGSRERPEGKVYSLTAAGQSRVGEWLSEVSWPKPDMAEFHLKLVAAATAGLADPVGIIDTQRRSCCACCGRPDAAMAEPEGSSASLLLEDRAAASGRICAGWRPWRSVDQAEE